MLMKKRAKIIHFSIKIHIFLCKLIVFIVPGVQMKLKMLQKRSISWKNRWKIRYFSKKNHVFTNPCVQMLSTKIIGFPFQIFNFNAKSTFSSFPEYRCFKNCSFLFKMWWKIVLFHETWIIFMQNWNYFQTSMNPQVQ